jgi:hypothetical protein
MNAERILAARPVVFWLLVVCFFAGVTCIAVFVCRAMSLSAKREISEWAHRNGLTIIQAEERHGLNCGPFTWTTSRVRKMSKIFKIVVRERAGATKSGWIRLDAEPEIVWDETKVT